MDHSQADYHLTLIKAIAAGDRLAFEKLYKLTSPYLFAVALRMLRHRASAEEVLHESFITVWTNAASYNHALSAPVTWMTHIVRNRCLDILRNGYVRLREVKEEYDEEILSSESREQDDGQVSRLEHCLQHLSAEQRQSISLAYYQGLSHQEIADWLTQPVGSVKSWIRRGLEHLRECVGL